MSAICVPPPLPKSREEQNTGKPIDIHADIRQRIVLQMRMNIHAYTNIYIYIYVHFLTYVSLYPLCMQCCNHTIRDVRELEEWGKTNLGDVRARTVKDAKKLNVYLETLRALET